jgi:UDPglucose 6-dehydrogenase
MKVTLYGIGYVDWVQAALLADAGHDVCCVDTDETRIENLKKDVVPFFEPGLTPLVVKIMLKVGWFYHGCKIWRWVWQIAVYCLSTPPDEDGPANFKYVLKVGAPLPLICNIQKSQ